jgi:hypothetical protein
MNEERTWKCFRQVEHIRDLIGYTFETSKVTTTYTNTFLSREHISLLHSQTQAVGDLGDIQNTRQKKRSERSKAYANRVGHRDTHFVH